MKKLLLIIVMVGLVPAIAHADISTTDVPTLKAQSDLVDMLQKLVTAQTAMIQQNPAAAAAGKARLAKFQRQLDAAQQNFVQAGSLK